MHPDSIPALLARRRAGFSLERAFYTSGSVHEADLEAVFLRHWLFAGVEPSIPKPGDYFTLSVGRNPLIIIRDDSGMIHALHDSCRHRGSRICTQPSGAARALVCPYHQWVYAPSGELRTARLMPEDFDKGPYGLKRARVETVEGLIFVALSDDAPDFSAFRDVMTPRLSTHRIASAKVAAVRRYEIEANWKLVLENSRECYHCAVGHPQYVRAVGFAAAIASPDVREQNEAMTAEQAEALKQFGIEASPVPFTPDSWFHYRHFPLRPGVSSQSMDGAPVAPLMGAIPSYETGSFAIVTLPNLLLEANPDYVMTLRVLPAGPRLTHAEVTWLVDANANSGADYTEDRLTEFWRLTSEQDWKLCEDNQAGVESMAYEPGPYAPSEQGVEHFVRWYLQQLGVAASC